MLLFVLDKARIDEEYRNKTEHHPALWITDFSVRLFYKVASLKLYKFANLLFFLASNLIGILPA